MVVMPPSQSYRIYPVGFSGVGRPGQIVECPFQVQVPCRTTSVVLSPPLSDVAMMVISYPPMTLLVGVRYVVLCQLAPLVLTPEMRRALRREPRMSFVYLSPRIVRGCIFAEVATGDSQESVVAP